MFQTGAVTGGDYSLHPLILGDGFELDDVNVSIVNKIPKRTSGEFTLKMSPLI